MESILDDPSICVDGQMKWQASRRSPNVLRRSPPASEKRDPASGQNDGFAQPGTVNSRPRTAAAAAKAGTPGVSV